MTKIFSEDSLNDDDVFYIHKHKDVAWEIMLHLKLGVKLPQDLLVRYNTNESLVRYVNSIGLLFFNNIHMAKIMKIISNDTNGELYKYYSAALREHFNRVCLNIVPRNLSEDSSDILNAINAVHEDYKRRIFID